MWFTSENDTAAAIVQLQHSRSVELITASGCDTRIPLPDLLPAQCSAAAISTDQSAKWRNLIVPSGANTARAAAVDPAAH